jgi:hypothetical protein
MLEKLYSPEQVLATFPEGHRTSLRRLIAKAKEANCCCKLGRGIGFTEEQVKALLVYISQPSRNLVPNHHPGRRTGSTYTEVRARLISEKKK